MAAEEQFSYRSIAEVLFESSKTRQIANLSYEISLVLYKRKNSYWGLENFDVIGNREGVDLPPVSSIIEGCRLNHTKEVVLVHNHPYIQGRCSPEPSKLDIATTRKYFKWLNQAGIKLLDHIIISPEGHCSFVERGIPFQKSSGPKGLLHFYLRFFRLKG